MFTELMATRAVIAERRTYEHAHRWQGDHRDGVPVLVLTHDVLDDPARQRLLRHRRARVRRAGVRRRAAQALLRAGQLDELELYVVPVVLGQSRLLFGGLEPEHVELDLVRALQAPACSTCATGCGARENTPTILLRGEAGHCRHARCGARWSTAAWP